MEEPRAKSRHVLGEELLWHQRSIGPRYLLQRCCRAASDDALRIQTVSPEDILFWSLKQVLSTHMHSCAHIIFVRFFLFFESIWDRTAKHMQTPQNGGNLGNLTSCIDFQWALNLTNSENKRAQLANPIWSIRVRDMPLSNVSCVVMFPFSKNDIKLRLGFFVWHLQEKQTATQPRKSLGLFLSSHKMMSKKNQQPIHTFQSWVEPPSLQILPILEIMWWKMMKTYSKQIQTKFDVVICCNILSPRVWRISNLINIMQMLFI